LYIVFATALAVRLLVWAAIEHAGTSRVGPPGKDGHAYIALANSLAAGRGYVRNCPRVRLDNPPIDVYMLSNAKPDGAIETLRRLHRRYDLSHLRVALCHDSRVGKLAATAPPIEQAAYPAPGYPAFLATLKLLAGSSFVAVATLIQCVLDAATAVLLALAIRRLAPRAPRWIYFAWCFYLPAVTVANEILTDSVALFLAVASVVLVVVAPVRATTTVLAGVALALSVSIRPQFLVAGLVLAAVVIWQKRDGLLRRLSRGALLAAPAVALTLAWCARNYTVFGTFAIGPPGGGLLFYSVAAPAHALLYGDGRLANSQRVLLEQYAPVVLDRPRDVFSFQAVLGKCARDWFRKHPLAAPAVTVQAMWRKLAGVQKHADPLRHLLGNRTALHLQTLAKTRNWKRLTVADVFVFLWSLLSCALALVIAFRWVQALADRRSWRNPVATGLLLVGLLAVLPVLPLGNRRYVVHFLAFWVLGGAAAYGAPAESSQPAEPQRVAAELHRKTSLSSAA